MQIRHTPLSGGYCGEVPPLPIPNREVKLTCADGTALPCGRVGSRQFLKETIRKVVSFFVVPRCGAPCCSVLRRAQNRHFWVLRQISCCQVTQVWKILIQRSRSEARPYILLFIYFILLFSPSISPLLIEYFMAFLMGEMSRWTLFTKLTTSP